MYALFQLRVVRLARGGEFGFFRSMLPPQAALVRQKHVLQEIVTKESCKTSWRRQLAHPAHSIG